MTSDLSLTGEIEEYLLRTLRQSSYINMSSSSYDELLKYVDEVWVLTSKPFLPRAFVAIDLAVLQHFLDEYYRPEAISKYMNRNLNGEYLKTNESMGPGGLWTRLTQVTLFLSLKGQWSEDQIKTVKLLLAQQDEITILRICVQIKAHIEAMCYFTPSVEMLVRVAQLISALPDDSLANKLTLNLLQFLKRRLGVSQRGTEELWKAIERSGKSVANKRDLIVQSTSRAVRKLKRIHLSIPEERLSEPWKETTYTALKSFLASFASLDANDETPK